MSIRLTDAERSRLGSMVRRPRSRKQLHRAEVLLALDAGRPIEEVARQHHMGVERVEGWIDAFATRRIKFLDEPDAGRPSRADVDDADEAEDDA